MAESTDRQIAALYLKILLGISCIFAAPFAVASFFACPNTLWDLFRTIGRVYLVTVVTPLVTIAAGYWIESRKTA